MARKILQSGFLVLFFLLSCAATKVRITTNPQEAVVWIYNQDEMQKARVVSNRDWEIENKDDFFLHFEGNMKIKQKEARVYFFAEKKGFASIGLWKKIQKGESIDVNNVSLKLDPIDTHVSFTSDPPGCRVTFYSKQEDAVKDVLEQDFFILSSLSEIPPNVRKSLDELFKYVAPNAVNYINTPFSQDYTRAQAERFFNSIRVVRVENEGYIHEIDNFEIIPGKLNAFSFKLRPFRAVLKVTSSPENVHVEDMQNTNGFGYLGETPFIRKFNMDECKTRGGEMVESQKISLTLKATRQGFEDEYKKIDVPFDEEISLHFTMKESVTQISFLSDPPQAHVYVIRIKKKFMPNPKNDNKLEDVEVEHLKYLGSTPFTYFMDRSEKLEHMDKLLVRKSGFEDYHLEFTGGSSTYHAVLNPLSKQQ